MSKAYALYRPTIALPAECPPTLYQRDWDVLVMRREGKTLQEIAGLMGITRERVRQIESSATRILQGKRPPRKTVEMP